MSIKEVPENLHQKLKERALRNHRSLNSEILAILESVLFPEPADIGAILNQARKLRSQFQGQVSEADLQEAKRMGRK